MAAKSNLMWCQRHLFFWKATTLCLLSWRTWAQQWLMLLAVKRKSVVTWRCWILSHRRLFLLLCLCLHIHRALYGQLSCGCFTPYFLLVFIPFLLTAIFMPFFYGRPFCAGCKCIVKKVFFWSIFLFCTLWLILPTAANVLCAMLLCWHFFNFNFCTACLSYRRRRSEVTSAGQCLYARILQFQHTITNTNTNI